MSFDPKALDLDALFVNPRMFDSRDAWRSADFTVLPPAKPTECMVASHPSSPGCLFKKYTIDVSIEKQRENYEARARGAKKLARFIGKEGLKHVVVPRKYLHDLPDRFGKKAQILVVERLDVLGPDESVLRYRDISDPVLHEWLAVVAKFEGLDSNAKNIPFLRDGRVAFVDLENWERRKKHRLRNLSGYLSPERLKVAKKILDDLK